MASRLVGVMGRARHGKDTFAARLVTAHGFTRIAFADPLREDLYRLDPLVRIEHDETGPLELGLTAGGTYRRLRFIVDLVGWERAKAVREVRRLLQEYGVGVREREPSFWVDLAMRAADAVTGPVVVSDVRFPNEAATVRSHGGTLVYVTNPRVPCGRQDLHVSETSVSWLDADLTIWNGSTLDALYRQADALAYR